MCDQADADAGEPCVELPLTELELVTLITCARYVRTHNASFLDLPLPEAELYDLEQELVSALVDLRAQNAPPDARSS